MSDGRGIKDADNDPDWPRDTEARCHALAQRNGGKVSQKRSGKEEGGGGRGWRREGGVRRKEDCGVSP